MILSWRSWFWSKYNLFQLKDQLRDQKSQLFNQKSQFNDQKNQFLSKSPLILKKSIDFDLFQLSFDINGPDSNWIVAMKRSDCWNQIEKVD